MWEATNLFNWSRTQNENENECLNYKVPGKKKKKKRMGRKSWSPISGVPSKELWAQMVEQNVGRCGLLHSSYPNCDVTFKGSRWPHKILIFLLAHRPNWMWDDCDSHLVKNTKMLCTDWINIFNKLQDNTFILHKNFSSRNLSLNNFTAVIYTFWNFPY